MEPLFSQYSLQSSIDNQPKAIREKVENFGEDYVLTVPEEDLGAAITAEAQWDPPLLGEAFIAADREIDVRRSDTDYGRPRIYTTKATQIEIHIPFSGDPTFFRIQPAQRKWTTPSGSIHSDHLEIILEGTNLSPETVRREIEKFVADIKFHLDQIIGAAKSHNEAIADKIRSFIQRRKKESLNGDRWFRQSGFPSSSETMRPRRTRYQMYGGRRN
jgi:hypothetical protein